MRVEMRRNAENTTLVDVILLDDAGVPVSSGLVPRDWVRRLYANAYPFTVELIPPTPPADEPAAEPPALRPSAPFGNERGE